MDPNPWSKAGFQTQICCIIIAPTFICAAIYLTLKHVALALGPQLSRIQPRWYPRLFLPADLSCLIIQAIGGGVAASAGRDKPDLVNSGNRLIISGVALQVVVLLIFGTMGLDYYIRVKKHLHNHGADPAALRVWRDAKFRRFMFAVVGAYFAIFTRCIYRYVDNLSHTAVQNAVQNADQQNCRNGRRLGKPHYAGRAQLPGPGQHACPCYWRASDSFPSWLVFPADGQHETSEERDDRG